MTDPMQLGYRRLAAAVLYRAALDAADRNGHSAEARLWLSGPLAHDLLDALDLDRETVATWVEKLPALAQPALL